MHKILHTGEALLMLLAIHWQPIFGIVASCCGGLYYMSMLKINVIDVKYQGSWKTYFKSILKRK